MGQVIQKNLIHADYNLWSRLSAGALSEDSKWVTYSLSYESGKDTLFVKHVDEKITYSFPGGHDGRFFGKDQFACVQRDNVFKISRLKTGMMQKLDNVQRYEILNDGRIVIELDYNGQKQLTVLDGDRHLFNIMEITAWSYCAKADAIIYVTNTDGHASVTMLALNSLQTFPVAEADGYTFSDFAWQENGEAVAFLKRYFTDPKEVHIGLYRLKKKKYYEFFPEEVTVFPKNLTICSVSSSPLILSPDGRKVFFGLEPKTIVEFDSNVQVWNTGDKLVYPDKVRRDGFNAVNKAGCWWPDNGKFLQLTDNQLPHIMLSGDMRHALLWNPIDYQPQQKQFGDTDCYLMDVETESKKLLLEKQSGDESQTFFSAAGKYVSYFRDGNWWIYDIKKRTSKNLTKDLSIRFYDEQYDWAGDIPSYGSPGWTTDDNYMLIYDQYDLWKISPDGIATRLTHGRETNTKFRIIPKDELQRGGINFTGKRKGLFNLSEGLLLSASGIRHNGFYKWNSTAKYLPLAVTENLTTSPIVGRENQNFMYIEQNYNLPPRLMLRNSYASKILFQSNPQHFHYKWGQPKIINYQNSKGQQLQGILYYPADYDATKKYPVIVRIYEKLSGRLHDYVNPSLHNQAGFNKMNFITQGYFVFEPDIFYELGNPGLSAVDCVISAVNSIRDIPAVDEKKMGLIGHSFGGYETNLIITKTNLFAAAVAGAGISDLTTHFLYLNMNSSRPNNYHFESGQFRMGKSLFENPEGYAANSPINFVNNTNTPLLSWAGENDRQVSTSQSMEFHMALRRLSKPNVMLIYKGETHALMGKDNQVDLAKRVEEWFGYFLKGAPAPEWMSINWIR